MKVKAEASAIMRVEEARELSVLQKSYVTFYCSSSHLAAVPMYASSPRLENASCAACWQCRGLS